MKIKKCLAAIRACSNLNMLLTLPFYRCHSLKGKYKDCYGLDIKHPFRIVIEPTEQPVPLAKDKSIDTIKVTSVTAIYIGDYHD